MGTHHGKRFPGEGDAYRDARDTLLAAEKELRLKTEEVAVLRRALPAGGAPVTMERLLGLVKLGTTPSAISENPSLMKRLRLGRMPSSRPLS